MEISSRQMSIWMETEVKGTCLRLRALVRVGSSLSTNMCRPSVLSQ